MKLIVGLGNPGKEYLLTRHNAGFLALDTLQKRLAAADFRADKKMHGEITKGKNKRQVLLLLKPTTFMNDSGMAVQAALSFYKLTAADLLVIHDDKDVRFGETRLQTNRGPAGHNGVLSIIEKLGTQDFARIRIGVAPLEAAIVDTADFVLGKFTAEEQKQLSTIFDHVVRDVQTWLAS